MATCSRFSGVICLKISGCAFSTSDVVSSGLMISGEEGAITQQSLLPVHVRTHTGHIQAKALPDLWVFFAQGDINITSVFLYGFYDAMNYPNTIPSLACLPRGYPKAAKMRLNEWPGLSSLYSSAFRLVTPNRPLYIGVRTCMTDTGFFISNVGSSKATQLLAFQHTTRRTA